MTPGTRTLNTAKKYRKKTTVEFEPYAIASPGVARAGIKKLPVNSVQFISVLAHEVRNPLTNINLSIKMLESMVHDQNLKPYLDIITRSSVRINGLMNELIKYQQADEAPAHKYSIHRLLDEVIHMTKDRILLKNIKVTKHFGSQDFKMVLNRPKMKIAFTNIIINAIDAMKAEGELKLVTGFNKDKYILQIEDNGTGISKENLAKIFKPYFTNKPGGLGIGLAATYDILHSNYIGLNVESKEGRGTKFTLVFEKENQYNLFNKTKPVNKVEIMHP